MQPLPAHVAPFAVMLDPQSVLDKIERSERLERLHRRVCRPLDKPLLGVAGEEDTESDESLTDDGSAGGPAPGNDTPAGSAQVD